MHPELLFHWQRAPFLRAVLPLMAGIAWQWYIQAPIWASLLPGVLGLGGLLLVFALPHRFRFRFGYLGILCQGLLFFSLGSLLCTTADSRSHSRWIGYHLSENTNAIEVVLTEEPVEKARTYRVIAEALTLQNGEKKIPVSGRLLLYLKKQPSLATLRPGDRILLHKIPERIHNAGNPGEFDQEQLWLLRGITHSVFADSSQYQLLKGTAQGFVLLRWISQFRHAILDRLHKNFTNETAAGLASALLIGYRNELDPELAAAYSNTGVIHVIAISGLHLALLGWLLEKIVSPFKKTKLGLFLSQLVLLSVLWVFSLLAEATPSVLRAVILFTVLGTGQLLDRKGNSLNTLAAAAFLLLCYNPFWLWDLGFQLSFIAVLSILIFGKRLSQIFSHANFLIHQLGQLVAVSLAAQILTTPFTLFYFHQFPASFLLSNLVAVPLSSIILGAALLTCLLAYVPVVGIFIASATEGMILLMNKYVQWVEAIPGMLWKNLYWSFTETVLLLLLCFALSHWLLNKATTGRIFSLLLGTVLLLMQVAHKIQASPVRLIVYNHKKHTLVEFMKGNQSQVFADSLSFRDPSIEKYLLSPSHQFFNIRHTEKHVLPLSFEVDSLTMLCPHKNYEPQNKIADTVEVLLLTRQAPYDPGPWLKNKTIRSAVFTGALGARTAERWRSSLDSLRIPIHDMVIKGAFVYSPR